jgi:catechol 2,3-dioxygenase-like lactoylglutathione lyase family enzyme
MTALLVHVGVRAADLKRSLGFWRDGLGLRVAATMPGSTDLTDGYHNFRIFQHAGPARPAHLGGMLDYLHIGVRVSDLREAAQRLQAAGYNIFWDGVDAGKPYDPSVPPSKSFKVEDPDGIVVDVTASADQWPGVCLAERDDSHS